MNKFVSVRLDSMPSEAEPSRAGRRTSTANCVRTLLGRFSGDWASFGVLAILIVVLKTFNWGELFTKLWFIVPMVIVLTAFEMLIQALQAYIFTVLTAQYIGGALEPGH